MKSKNFVDDHVMAFVKDNTNRKVISGPFRGMAIVDDYSWSNLDCPSKLLGTYEQELHPHLWKMKNCNFDCVLDIGCAEGYYANGFARLYSSAIVYAFDTDENAQAICGKNALINGVQDRLLIHGQCTSSKIVDISKIYRNTLVFCDCEGYEVDLFKNHHVRCSLALSCIIIECHDFVVPRTTEIILEYFSDTHIQYIISSGARNPNEFPFMARLTEFDRWRAVCEYRPCPMNWVVCYPKNAKNIHEASSDQVAS